MESLNNNDTRLELDPQDMALYTFFLWAIDDAEKRGFDLLPDPALFEELEQEVFESPTQQISPSNQTSQEP